MSDIKRSYQDVVFDLVNYFLMTIAVLIVLYPLYFILIASISDPYSIYEGRVWLIPQGITFEGYEKIVSDDSIGLGYWNSIVYTAVGTAINVSLTLPAAYALSRRDLTGRKAIMLIITFTMFFSGGLIPIYLVVKNLGMIDKIWAMVIPNAVGTWNLIIARTFFQTTIPAELHDAGKIDGCTDAKFFSRVVLPVSGALIAIMVLFYGVSHWNAFFNGLIYLRREEKYPLQLVLRKILLQEEVQDMMTDIESLQERQRGAELIKYGTIIAASVPMLILYPFLQKYFVKGIMVGSLKG